MTLDELLAKLKRIEAAAQARDEYAGEVSFEVWVDGSGYCRVTDKVYPSIIHHSWGFSSLDELPQVLDTALAEVEAE